MSFTRRSSLFHRSFFIDWAKNWTTLLRKRMGFRFHWGELSKPDEKDELDLYNRHLEFGMQVLEAVIKERIPVRIGHGVALGDTKWIERLLIASLMIDTDKSDFANPFIPISVEINISSNDQLLHNTTGQHAGNLPGPIDHFLKNFKSHQFSWALSTDDDGIIWRLEDENKKSECVSVGYEAWKAFQRNYIIKEELEMLSKNGMEMRFGQPTEPPAS